MRETRLTGMMSHIFIGLSLFLLPYPLAYIPTAVLDGLFLYMAVTALNGNQMFERITLLFMEQVLFQCLMPVPMTREFVLIITILLMCRQLTRQTTTFDECLSARSTSSPVAK